VGVQPGRQRRDALRGAATAELEEPEVRRAVRRRLLPDLAALEHRTRAGGEKTRRRPPYPPDGRPSHRRTCAQAIELCVCPVIGADLWLVTPERASVVARA